MEPASWDGLAMLQRNGVDVVRSNQFLCHHDEFAAWAGARTRLKMEDFYRWQRRRLGVLMDGDDPAGGRWNFDDREPRAAAEARRRPGVARAPAAPRSTTSTAR